MDYPDCLVNNLGKKFQFIILDKNYTGGVLQIPFDEFGVKYDEIYEYSIGITIEADGGIVWTPTRYAYDALKSFGSIVHFSSETQGYASPSANRNPDSYLAASKDGIYIRTIYHAKIKVILRYR